MGGGASKSNLSTYMREKREEAHESRQPGPFITISRQYGCSGYFLGLLLVDLLNNDPDQKQPWRAYSKEILTQLSGETDIAVDTLDRLRREQPRALVDFFRSLSTKRMPGGLEVRNRIAGIVRQLATDGHAIIIGMGGAGATADIPNGLRLRLEAPPDWRVARIVECEGLSTVQARMELQKQDRERDRLQAIYHTKFRREPPFDLVYDCSTFTLAQIAQHALYAMKLMKML